MNPFRKHIRLPILDLGLESASIAYKNIHRIPRPQSWTIPSHITPAEGLRKTRNRSITDEIKRLLRHLGGIWSWKAGTHSLQGPGLFLPEYAAKTLTLNFWGVVEQAISLKTKLTRLFWRQFHNHSHSELKIPYLYSCYTKLEMYHKIGVVE